MKQEDLPRPPLRDPESRKRPAQAFPRTAVRGGDRLWGASFGGPGHAGRRRIRQGGIILAVLAALSALVLSLVPEAAQANQGSMRWTYDHTDLITEIKGTDGSQGYCAQVEKLGPGGTYTEWHWVSEMDAETLRGDPHGIAWLLAHCYPRQTSFYGVTLDETAASHVSQAAIWMYQGDMTKDGYQARTGHTLQNLTQQEAELAWQLAEEAKTHDGEAGAWDYVAQYWIAPGAQTGQNIVSIPPAGSILVSKQNATPEISLSGTGYSLEGAVFGLYRDEACTQEISRFTTGADGTARLESISPGTWYVKEIEAPAGWQLSQTIFPVTVTAGNESRVDVPEVPRYSVPDILIRKSDSESAAAQGNATLEGAEFSVKFFAEGTATDGAATKSWVLKTDADGIVRLDDAHKVSGDSFYRLQDGTVILPLGTLAIEETKAPEGYRLPDQNLTVVTIAADAGSATGATRLQETAIAEEAIRGGLAIQKLDKESGGASALGKAAFAGATFSVANASSQAVIVDGTSYAPGETIMSIVADESGQAATAADALPYGTYLVKEAAAPQGYLLDSSWEARASISEDGKVTEISGAAACADQVIRGDLSFVKEDAETAARMAGIPFRIASLTTGEWHIAVTDENGILDTSAGQAPHSKSTNANDAALREDGTVDDSLLDASAGIWFAGSAEANIAADDALGALPFDVYEIEELPCAANEDKKLVSFEATISRNGFTVYLGTVSNENGPHIETTLTSEEGEHIAPATDEPFTLVDTVAYSGLTAGETYELTGTLMDCGTGEPLEGTEPATATFVPASSSGTQEVTFTVSQLPSTCRRIVAFERLEQDGKEIAVHADIEDEGQTVRFSELQTEAAAASDGSHTLPAADAASIVDTVSYTGLLPGETYTLTATLHLKDSQGNDGGALLNAGGETIAFTQDFVAEAEDGTAEVPISFDATSLAGRTIVVFERLEHRGHEVGNHEDIADEAQAVSFEAPGIPDTGDTQSLLWTALGAAGIATLAGGILIRRRR